MACDGRGAEAGNASSSASVHLDPVWMYKPIMPFSDKLKSLAQRLPQTIGHLETEEATKNALVMPFLAALGYDVFDPTEVVPEYTADVGTKKGEKVDYAIKRNGEIMILVEAKKAGVDLSSAHSNQLFRYFTVTSARIGLLTNGIVYRFFSDLEQPNVMDEKPFLEIDLRDLKENLIKQLAKITKGAFDLEEMLNSASDLKYMREIRQAFEQQMEAPEEDFVKFFFTRVNPNGRFVQSAREQFSGLVKQTFQQVISDRVSERLRAALDREGSPSSEVPASQPPRPAPDEKPDEGAADASDGAIGNPSGKDGIETTEEELDGYRIVKAIVCAVLPGDRVTYRDAKSYFAVLTDDNNRKPICRLHLNSASKKYLGLFDDLKQETRHAIASVEEIYGFAEQLRASASKYLEPTRGQEPAQDPS